MRRTWVALCSLSMLLGCGGGDGPASPSAQPLSPVPWGSVQSVVGEGAFQLCNAECKTVRHGAELTLGSAIVTDAEARAVVELGDGSKLRLDTDSTLQLRERGRVELEQGRALLSAKEPVVFVTPAGDVIAGPGEISIDVRPGGAGGGRTQVNVLSGSATLESGGQRYPMGAGESAYAGGDKIEVLPSRSVAYQTSWARHLAVEAEVDDDDVRVPEGIGAIIGRDPATRQDLPEAITIPSMDVNVTVRGRVARTEISQTFRNNTGKTLEGIYQFPLPHDASIVRFAMTVNGELMEGEIVERGKAVRIFNRVVADYMRPRDPALLEWKSGNVFQLRIFPIFPHKAQRVVLWYTQVLEADGTQTRYAYPLPRTGKVGIDHFKFTAEVQTSQPLAEVRTPLYASSVSVDGQVAQVSFDKERFHPRQDLVMEWAVPQHADAGIHQATDSEGGDPYFMMVLRPDLPVPTGRPLGTGARDHVFVVDASYGTAQGDLAAQIAGTASWLSTLGPDDRFTVVLGGQSQKVWKPSFQRVTHDSVSAAMVFLEEAVPGGASDLEAMFAVAAELAGRSEGAAPAVIYLGDGQATIGEIDHDALLDSVDRNLHDVQGSVHAVGVGNNVNVALLGQLTRRFGGSVTVLNRGEDVPSRVAQVALDSRRPALRQGTLAFSSEKVDLVYPTHVPTLRYGEELVVVGRYRGKLDGQVTLTGLVGDEPFAQPFRAQLDSRQARSDSFVPRIWAQRHIEHLTLHAGVDAREEIVKASKQHTVMSRYTTFLVLESERMYRQYKVERKGDRAYWTPTGGAAQDPAAAEAPARSEEDADEASNEAGENAPAFADDGDGDDLRDDNLEGEAPLLDSLGYVQPDTGALAPVITGGSPGIGDFADGARGKTGGLGLGGSAGGAKGPRLAGADKAKDMAVRSADAKGDGRAAATRPKGVEAKLKKAPSARPAVTAKPKESKPELDAPRKSRKTARGSSRERRVYVPPPVSIRSVQAQPSADDARTRQLQAAVAADPLRRSHRQSLVRHLVARGDAAAALEAARLWVEKDASNPSAHWALADLASRRGEVEAAQIHFGNAVELAPLDPSQLRAWARNLVLRGDVKTAVAVHRAVASRTGHVDDVLDLVAVEAMVAPKRARDHLARLRAQRASELDAKQARRADELAEVLASGRGDTLAGLVRGDTTALRGAGVVTLSWVGNANLDLSVTLPYGERISPDMPWSRRASGKRGYVAAVAQTGATHKKSPPREGIVLPWAPRGTYRIEVVRRGDTSAPVQATVAVRFRGARRVFQVEIPAGDEDVRVAQVTVR